ncbi:hypothetical protein [Bradyrhizobium sp. SBR1B]|uniref:hypothetical protein n=1 Tax=Bradyrhizobium sp. SBR1B TaxID=2663836 RepID=UPI001605F798|nr:hypothetical protein [Bradyrhizobium sp. SBR1B]MBB4378234.1 hypothetical protein [Bradyrhizobium sp. SBR1B]
MPDDDFSYDKVTDPDGWARRKALGLFLEIRELLGEKRARQLFAIWGTPPTPARLNEIENMGLIDRLDIEFKGNVKAFARALAAEKYANPSVQQTETVERQIQRLNVKRKKNPFWPDGGKG